ITDSLGYPFAGPIDFSSDGKFLVIAGGETMCPLEVATGKRLWQSPIRISPSFQHRHIRYSPDGLTIALTVHDEDGIRLAFYESATGKKLRELKSIPEAICSVAFSPDGKWVAIGSRGPSVRIYET